MKNSSLVFAVFLISAGGAAYAQVSVCDRPGMVEFQVQDGGVEAVVESAKGLPPIAVTVCNKSSRSFAARRGVGRDEAAAWQGTAPTLEPGTCTTFRGFDVVIADASDRPAVTAAQAAQDAQDQKTVVSYIQGCYRIE